MKRVFILLCIFIFISCQDKVICPAYQSTYILDDSTRSAFYSYVWQLDESTRTQFLAQNDTTPNDSLNSGLGQQPPTDYYAYAGEQVVPWRVPARTKYGVIKPVFMPVKKYRMRTAPMENVFGPDPISNELVTDSLTVDSLSVATSDSLQTSTITQGNKEDTVKFLYGYDPADHFNVEQFYYNKYFSDRLIDTRPEPEQPMDTLATDPLNRDSLQSKEPFFKSLFKKKKKKESDPTPEEDDQSEVDAPESPGTEEEEEGG